MESVEESGETKRLGRRRKPLKVRCFGGSMTPLVRDGDVIEVVPPERAFRRFDVIVFRHDGELICHYVSSLSAFRDRDGRPCLLTRGIANTNTDPFPVEESEVLGIVRGVRLGFAQKLISVWRDGRSQRRRRGG